MRPETTNNEAELRAEIEELKRQLAPRIPQELVLPSAQAHVAATGKAAQRVLTLSAFLSTSGSRCPDRADRDINVSGAD